MKTEKQKMIAGEPYLASDKTLTQERLVARKILKSFNESEPDEAEKRKGLLDQLVGKAGKNFHIEPPFYCDYGYNIEVGEDVFFNFNCIVLDVTPVKLGSRVLCGPNVQFYAATHPMDADLRGTMIESGKPITVGDDVWIGGSVVICPGVKIGSRSVIGAGSVVTRDIPDDVFAAGNPCKVIKKLNL
ncbi:Maltose O-acetyltransferase [Indibacter alkaliphilus LW1]|jgi:maltose O-acetyltransferase|uniref:Maltose O-acetyltransferase n=1 Tax=Indibacter alkaliphilus (strain CCUG 57479 / KCTC 22604 / LW1) TaxID=1189612 RepID=S2DKH2_INDAL|nr:sugar O-acetyltransferase [Indibacter alkaliphilus]EOZ97725.1 Maltose O-acetyltransferase [Indibacter alkaliphilus LW1]